MIITKRLHRNAGPYSFAIDSFQSTYLKKMVFDAVKSESISLTFYKQLLRQYYYDKKLQSQTLSRETLRKTLAYKKSAHKILVKLTP